MRRFSSRIHSLLAGGLGVVLLLAAPGGADPAVSGHFGNDAQGSDRSADLGPSVPGADYLEVIEELEEPTRDRRIVADSEGHLLLQDRFDTGDGIIHRLVAVNASDGSTAWVTDHVNSECGVVATDDGRIFAQLEPNSPAAGSQVSADVAVIDAETGQILDQYTPADTEDPGQTRLGVCLDSLRLAADDRVVVLYSGARQTSGNVVLRTFTTDGGLAEDWIILLPQLTLGQQHRRPVVSPDGGSVFVGHIDDTEDPIRLAMARFDVTTGESTGSVEIPGTQFAEAGGIAHDGTGVIVGTRACGGCQDPERLVRVSAGADLSIDWVVEADEDGPFPHVLGTVALGSDQVITFDGSMVAALALADGAVRWTHRPSSFSNNGSQVITDAGGNVYLSSFGGAALESLTPDGRQRFVTDSPEEFLGEGVVGEAVSLGPVIDGRLYTLFATLDTPRRAVLAAIGQGEARLDGITGDPIDIAIQICQYLFADGEARTVVLSRDDVFADTLAGAPLAGDHSCILFTAGGPDQPLDQRTLAEIRRALPAGGTVRIAGGPVAVSAQVESTLQDAGFVVERLAGPGRLETAVEIGRVVRTENPGADPHAVLAFANNWPDAVTAGAAAAARGIPVLLTGTDELAVTTADALAEFGIQRTFVAGGTAVISEAAADAAPGPLRIAGPNRFGTAAAVATELWEGLARENAFVLANLEVEFGWALALAASPISVRLGALQLGVRAASVPPETEQYLRDAGVSDPGVFALGDVTVVDDDVVTQVTATGG